MAVRSPVEVEATEVTNLEIHGRNIKSWNINALQQSITYMRSYEPLLYIHAGACAGWLPTATTNEINRHLTVSKISEAFQIINNLSMNAGTILTENTLGTCKCHSLSNSNLSFIVFMN